MISFTCDYLEGCHPSILKRLNDVNLTQHVGYGMDEECEGAAAKLRQAFSCGDAAVHFLTGGTQANTTVIAAALRPYEGVYCADTGHINTHETGAVESSGHKCLVLPSRDGIITASQVSVAAALQADDEHTVKPGMVYISMSTELGTVYNLAQLKDLYYTCRQHGLYLFIDGARLGYALASPIGDVSPEDIARYSDVFTVGGTKMGALFGEAVVITNPELKPRFRYVMKQRGGMLAKGWLLGVQFDALMEGGLYFELGRKAVAQAMRIRTALMEKGLPLYADSSTNQLFPILTDDQLEALEEDFTLSVWDRVDEASAAVRICTSWATPDEHVDQLIEAIGRL